MIKASEWTNAFRSPILGRGREYYRYGRIVGIKTEDDHVSAIAWGSDDYKVEVSYVGNGNIELICNCPYAKGDNNCKHEAALMYWISEKKKDLLNSWISGKADSGKSKKGSSAAKQKGKIVVEKKTEYVHPFYEKASEKTNGKDGYKANYSYFDYAKMTKDIKITKEKYEKALKILDDNAIEYYRMRVEYIGGRYGGGANNYTMLGQYKDNSGNYWDVSVSMNRDSLLSSSCACTSCRINGYNSFNAYVWYSASQKIEELCEHTLALLLMSKEYIKKNQIGDFTGYNSARLLNSFKRNVSVDETSEIVPEVELDATLSIKNHSLYLSFRVGIDKMYVVKKPDALVDAVKGKSEYVLGKKSSINFSSSTFTDTSRELYNFMLDYVEEERRRTDYEDYYYGNNVQKDIPVYGQKLDRLFDMYKGSELAFKDNGVKETTLKFREKDLTLLFLVNRIMVDGKFEGITLTVPQPDLYEGTRYFYYVDGKNINRISEENRRVLEPFLDSKYDELHFDFGRRHLAGFYHEVLPQVEAYIHLQEESPDEIAKYVPPRAKFKFYLDAPQDEITCRIVVCYGAEDFTIEVDTEKGINLAKEAYRDIERENEVLFQIMPFFPFYDNNRNCFVSSNNPDQVYEILEFGIKALLQIGEVHRTDSFDRLRLKKQWKLTVGVSVESEIMTVDVISDELSRDELLDILKSYKKKQRYHRLKNGDFIKLEDDDNIHLLQELMEQLNLTPKQLVSGKMHIPLYRALYLNEMLEKRDDILFNRSKTFRELIKNFRTMQDSDYELPDSLKDIFRKYQKQGFRWMMTVSDYGFGGILADDMGLGKTLQTLGMLLYAKENGGGGTTLIVSPTSLVYNWREEIYKFAPILKVRTVTGSKAEREDIISHWEDVDILVTSYNLLQRDIDLYEGKSFSYAIIDEAQYIKNPKSVSAMSVKVLDAKHRLALTGTPIENRLSELWSIFDFLMPGYLYSYEQFKRDYEKPIAKDGDDEKKKRLRDMVTPFVMRRLKKDVLKDLPDKLEETRVVEFEKEQRELYDAQVTHMRALLDGVADEDFAKQKLQVLAELTRMRQICCNPSLIIDDYKGNSAKQEALMDLIEESIDGGHKLLVFSQFTSMLELIEKDLKSRDIEYFVLTGTTSKEERLRLVKLFNEESDNENTCRVFLISLKAGGTGLNLTGADIVIHYDPWWNIAVENQATDRAHRIGQKKVVSVYKLIVKGTIEEKILKLQEKKRELADEILKGEGGNLASLSKDELLALISE